MVNIQLPLLLFHHSQHIVEHIVDAQTVFVAYKIEKFSLHNRYETKV